jgi:ech hydrogenase subunit A
MYSFIICLFAIPAIVSGLMLILPKSLSRILVIATSFILSGISVYLFTAIDKPYYFGFPHYMNEIAATADIALLLYFGWVAVRRKSLLVGLLTILQMMVFSYLLFLANGEDKMQFMVDKLSVFMFLLINIISSLIAVYSLQYIDEEDCSAFRKKYFLSILFWFIAVMNLVVSADNLEYFFLFFELTTLASFLFIGFRKDDTSVKNALTALWMNQIGGLAILLAILYISVNGFGAATFTNLLAHSSSPGILLPLALFCVAALIKGAQMPFSKWLLGAMVAPTPVSALLHSSTMVKIAPFIMLRLSPALKDTPVASIVIGLTGFVFVAAAIAALSQDNFKRILAYSTVSLLALMIMMGAVGTPLSIMVSLILIFFHGTSKCMLFLNAGVMEKVFHLKHSSDMDKIGEAGPFTSFIVMIGFMSLALPPFGAFIGKWFSIETLGSFALRQKLLGAMVIVAIASGGAVLSLLYFKVLGILIARNGSRDKIKFEKLNPFYSGTIYILLGLVLAGILCFPFLLVDYFVPVASQTLGLPIDVSTEGWKLHIGSMSLTFVPLLIAFILFPTTIILAMFIQFRNVDRAKEYMCGEKIDYSFSSFYFSTDRAAPYFSVIGILFFVALIAVALF